MTSHTLDSGHTLLLRRVSAHIGMSCFLYIEFLFSRRSLLPFELEVLSRIFTSEHYSDTAVDEACFIALNRHTTSVISLLGILTELVQASRRP